jgi:hypothetical protein
MSILALTSDTLIGTAAAGNIEYNGQFFGTDSNASRAQMQRIVLSTAVASTSGTSIDFTGIPAWVERITVMFQGVSTSGTSHQLIQIGAGSVANTGYTSTGMFINSGSTPAGTSSTAGMLMYVNSATDVRSGTLILNLISGNIWVSNHCVKISTTGSVFGGGDVTLSGTLDRVRITTVNGTDTFDAGSINILYEG